MENEKENCILCGKELEFLENDFCESCIEVLKNKYQQTKLLEEKIKCHKKNAKKLKQ